ncbi:MAG: hypothetical protein DHS20C18_50130 [Saprospiraceae bacterium]|nr:MAG: hypothetical protein DHS20C18_50130 [Saprospiraceae bacterium]
MDSHTSLNAVCLYAKKDLLLVKEAEDFFDRLLTHGYFGELTYREVDLLSSIQLKPILDDADIIILLLSPDLANLKLCWSAPMKKAISKHQLDLLSVVPILAHNYHQANDPFLKISKLPHNDKPIDSKYWRLREDAFKVIFRELMEICRARKASKIAIYETWQKTLKENTLEGYEQFWKAFPHVPYVDEAKKKFQELAEEALWKKATEAGNIHTFVDYLIETPLYVEAHQFEAARRIYDMEQDEAKRCVEAEKEGVLKFYYRLKNHYYALKKKRLEQKYYGFLSNPDRVKEKLIKKYATEAQRRIYQKPFHYEEEPLKAEELENNYLDYLAAKKRKSHEIFDYQIYNTHMKQLAEDLERICADISMKRSKLIIWGGFIAFFVLFVSINAGLLFGVMGFLLLSLLFIYQWNCYFYLGTDFHNLHKGIASLHSLQVLLRVALVKHDKFTVSTIMNFSRFVEAKATEVKQKSLLDYCFLSATTVLGKEMEIPGELPADHEKAERPEFVT